MKKTAVWVPYGVAVIICIIATIPAFSKSLVLDEAYSVLLVRGGIGEIIHGAAVDVHPPLYYLLLKGLSFLTGETLLGYRIVTALASYLNLVWLGATLIRKRWGSRVAVIYIMWFGLSYSTLEKFTLIRMYSWGCFFVMAAVLFLFAYYEKRKWQDYSLAILFTLAAMYTHYYAVMAVFTAWVIIFAYTIVKERREVWKILLGGIVIFVGYLPWMGSLLAQSNRVANDYWIKVFDWAEWIKAPAEMLNCSLEGLNMVFYLMAIMAIVVAIFRSNYAALYCWAVFAGTMLLGAVLSVLVTPIWQLRYLYVAWGMLSLAVALVLGERRSEGSFVTQGVVFLMLCILGVFSVQSLLQSERVTTTADEWVWYAEHNIMPGDCVIVDDPYEHYIIYEFYTSDVEVIMTEQLEALDGKVKVEDVLQQYDGRGVWYIANHVLVKYGTEKMSEDLKKIGYQMEQQAMFTIEGKVLDIYRIEEINHEE